MSATVSSAQSVYAPPSAVATTPLTSGPRSRIASIDVIRGAVMVLMAIDHVRVYSGQPAGGPTPGIFFTRWITHFCAPAFVFLAGTGAYLYQQKLGGRQATAQVSRWLVTRGLWLVLLELAVLRFAWTFNFDYAHSGMAGVIWCIGWCMVLLAALIHLPLPAIAAIGGIIVAGHNLVDPYLAAIRPWLATSHWGPMLRILYFGGVIQLGSLTFGVLYSIVPWIGVMALGYAFGAVMRMDRDRRARICYAVGSTAIVAFLILRGTNAYGDPRHWHPRAGGLGVLDFLATTKYPASLLFLCMTLGPTLIAVPLLEHARGAVARILITFGRVPFLYYVLHIPLIHATALVVSLITIGRVSPWLFADHPMLVGPPPDGYTWSLGTLYLVWALVLIPLYFASRWYGAAKAHSRNPLLTYL